MKIKQVAACSQFQVTQKKILIFANSLSFLQVNYYNENWGPYKRTQIAALSFSTPVGRSREAPGQKREKFLYPRAFYCAPVAKMTTPEGRNYHGVAAIHVAQSTYTWIASLRALRRYNNDRRATHCANAIRALLCDPLSSKRLSIYKT